MTSTQKRVFVSLLLISLVYFVVFIFPNNTGAKDEMMISLFEPDEFAQYPVVTQMLEPDGSRNQTIYNFIAYGHYYYGSPFYVSSALLLLPLKLTQNPADTQLNMLLLRQFISILPMLGALLLLTHLQTKFKSPLKSIGLFVFLLSVSAVVENNLWWHVDSLAVLFVVLTLFLLDRDDGRFGLDFALAAISTGLATGTKVIGLFFVLTIPTYLLVGIISKKLTLRTAILKGILFVSIMAAAIVISNPFLLLENQRVEMIKTLTRQSRSMSEGWTLTYAKGPASWLHIIEELYGQLVFLALAFAALLLGIWRGENRTRHLLILTWALPLGLYVLFTIAIKPTHFFLPILLPVYSSLVVFFEFPPFNADKPRKPVSWLWGGLIFAVILYQFVAYVNKDVTLYREVLTREENEKSLVFYEVLEQDYLPRIQTDEQLKVFRDVRMYFPESPRWIVRTYWNSKYSTIEKIKPDIIILWSQRILDYTSESAQQNAVDPESFQDTFTFFVDADRDQLRGYRLVYRDGEGLMFVTESLYEQFFRE
ncbi:MAG: hypothetical protein HY865_16200 [Chloroflexi bacterium]|nr:hypothetical protein [Chloroflexota bacterium]